LVASVEADDPIGRYKRKGRSQKRDRPYVIVRDAKLLDVARLQNRYFTANCICLGVPSVLVIVPNAALPN
jgi:hypothetical protein